MENSTKVHICLWNDCNIQFPTLDSLVEHLMSLHIKTRQPKYKCEWKDCSRYNMPQPSRFALVSHVRSHTGEKPYYCIVPECAKKFTRSDALAKHIRTVHDVNNKKHHEYDEDIYPWWYYIRNELLNKESSDIDPFKNNIQFVENTKKDYYKLVEDLSHDEKLFYKTLYQLLFNSTDENINKNETIINEMIETLKKEISQPKSMKISSLIDSNDSNKSNNETKKSKDQIFELFKKFYQSIDNLKTFKESIETNEILKPVYNYKKRPINNILSPTNTTTTNSKKSKINQQEEEEKNELNDEFLDPKKDYEKLQRHYIWITELNDSLHKNLEDLDKEKQRLFALKESLLDANLKLDFLGSEKKLSKYLNN